MDADFAQWFGGPGPLRPRRCGGSRAGRVAHALARAWCHSKW